MSAFFKSLAAVVVAGAIHGMAAWSAGTNWKQLGILAGTGAITALGGYLFQSPLVTDQPPAK